jgi:2-polyprenyl-6-methoxyphenol hydroxylase-like FAD-dependent oxidoreductase
MSDTPAKEAQVLIVGAGPTGLMMACQLDIHHIPFRIIDKRGEPSNNSGALIVQARSLEIFEQMGIAAEMVERGLIAGKVNILFNGGKITSAVISDIGAKRSQFPFLLMLEQSIMEGLLQKFIRERGHIVERSVSFKSLIQEEEGITSLVVLADGVEQSIRTKYVFASDGAGSAIRNFLNISFKGKTYPKPIFILDCKGETNLPPGEISFAFTNSSIAGFFPLPGFRWRIDGTFPREPGKPFIGNIEDIRKNISGWTRTNFALRDYEWYSVTHAHQKYARSIRIQNCFLAGDAAHVNTPVGAQGMNTGLQDSFNLAWKLAFVINGKAKPEILDSYSSERLGISKGFARYADTIFKLVTGNNVYLKFLRLFILKVLFRSFFSYIEKRSFVRRKFFSSISQIGLQYRNSPLSYKIKERFSLNGAPAPGDRLPYCEFLYQGRITNNYEVLDISAFNLFLFANELSAEIKGIAEKYNLAVVIIVFQAETKKIYKRFGINNTGYYLIRPDHYIALSSPSLKTHHLNKYLQTFLKV